MPPSNPPGAGERFGILETTGKTEQRDAGGRARRFVECRCDCGSIFWTMQQALRSGAAQSCGCSRDKMKTAVSLTCEFCGAPFTRVPSQITLRGAGHYCSQECRSNGLRKDPVERFWAFTKKTDGCWLWTGATADGGYGVMPLRHVSERRAHRFSWTLHFGPIPDGLDVCHTCDNPPCVRPDHLFLGTPVDNALDMVSKGRHAAVTHPETISRGESRPAAKLTEETVREIRRMAAAGVSRRELAERYDVTPTLIAGVVNRTGWRHVAE